MTSRATSDAIAKIRAADLKSVDFEVLKALLDNAFIGFRTHAPWCQAGLIVYRGIGTDQKGKPMLRSRISYPPIELASAWGRVTRPGQRVFYASIARDAVAFELGLRAGDYVALGRWRSSESLLFSRVGFSRHVLHALGGGREAPDWSSQAPEGSNTLDLEIDSFFSEQFGRSVATGDEYLYKGTAAIAEHLFCATFTFGEIPGYDGRHRVAGLLYPSIATRGTADNVALLPEVVDDSLSLEFVEWSLVEATGENFCKLIPMDCAGSFGPNGEIEWKGRPPQLVVPPGGRCVQRDEGYVEAFDASGARIEYS